MTELQQAYERLNQCEDLMGCALAHLEGDPCYASKSAIVGYLKAYFEARKASRAVAGENAPSKEER